MLRALLVIFFLQCLPAESWLQSGFLDPDFGNGGWVHTDFGGGKDQANAVALQSNGKILVGGQTNGLSGGFDFALIRYLSNGELDPDFGNQGKMIWDFGSNQENIEFINVLKDDKIFIGGWTNSSPNSQGILMLLNPDGSPDPGFGNQGIVKYRIGRSTGPIAMAVQDDGKFVVSGITVIDSFDVDWLITRFFPDGTMDTSFNQQGYLHYKFFTRENIPFSITIQKDHKIFLTGCAGVTSKTNFAFLRLNPDGTPDKTFGIDGGLQTDFKNNQDVAYTSIVLDDGRIMVSGTAKDSLTNLDFALARYLPDGSLDPDFGVGGKLTHDLKGPLDNGLYMIRQPDGKFLMCGTNNIIAHNSYVVVRFNPDGSIDKSFGVQGKASLDVVNILPDNTPYFVMQNDGKIVMVHNYKDGTNINFLVMRFLNDITTGNKQGNHSTTSITLHPNPVTDILSIHCEPQFIPSESIIEILNVHAEILDRQVVLQADYVQQYSFNISHLSPGLFFVRFLSEGRTNVLPFIKLH